MTDIYSRTSNFYSEFKKEILLLGTDLKSTDSSRWSFPDDADNHVEFNGQFCFYTLPCMADYISLGFCEKGEEALFNMSFCVSANGKANSLDSLTFYPAELAAYCLRRLQKQATENSDGYLSQ